MNPFSSEILGVKSFRNLSQINEKVDIVDIFRPSEEVYDIVMEAISLKPKAIWMQEGIENLEAKDLAEKHNITVIMNKCIKKEHYRLIG